MPRTLLSRAKVCAAEPGVDLSATDVDDAAWLQVDVPGDLHRALTAAGRLPDLDLDDNTEQAAWVEDKEWWYRLRLPVSDGGPRRLVCDGLDTFVTLYVDGA